MKSVVLVLLALLGAACAQLSADCNLPSETGLCMALFHRFYYHNATGQCEGFVYGGCGGNANNFLSAAECRVTCITG